VNPLLRSSAAHVFVESLAAPTLDAEDAHHLLRVQRLRDGEVVTVSDGRGGWRACVLAAGELASAGPLQQTAPNLPSVTIAAAIPKGDRAEWMVQKLTEVGVDRIVLVDCARSVVRWSGERAARSRERLFRVAREAAMQSRRTYLPVVEGPLPVVEVLARPGTVAAEPGAQPWPPMVGATTVVVGPEGGFTAAELAHAAGVVSLGETVLRVETAAVVAAVLVTSMCS
jgi:16S rRNA (uracil1498-N3)-methyltransferase